MSVLKQIVLIFAVCLVSEGIAAVLPFPFPGAVLAMVILLGLLGSKLLKPEQIRETSGFFMDHMAMFFVPVCVSVLKYTDILFANFWSIVLISVLTTPLVFLVTGHVVQLTMKLMQKGETER